ncbi:MAG: (Fe-S)-binding protein [Candidatus Odinarchaeota archaeon]|nr:(Fe-S)-binding protein [Candidatus Odinarchaeota archaeon]
MNAESYVSELEKCMSCLKLCRFSCPVAEVTGSETYTPSGKTALLYYLLNNKLEWNYENTSPFYMCLLCGRCKEFCDLDVDIPNIMRAARYEAVKRNLAPSFARGIRDKILSSNNIYGKNNKERNKLLEKYKLTGKNDKILIFAGCKVSFEATDILDRFIDILNSANVDFSLLGEKEPCCGAPLFVLGFYDDFLNKAKETAEILNAGNYETIITLCPNCHKMLSEIYKCEGITLSAKIVHYTEFLNALRKEGKIIFEKIADDEIYGYHDPCKLADVDLFEAPRELLNAVTDNVREFQWNRKMTYCCGSGSSLEKLDSETSQKIGNNRIEEAEDLGITTIVTSCQTCVNTLFGLSNKSHNNIKVREITEILHVKKDK